MIVAFISDVHANLEALQAVLTDIEKQHVDRIHFLGDAVGYGSEPNACVELIDSNCDIKLLGNHDYAALGLESPASFNDVARVSIEWTLTELSSRSTTALADFEMEAVDGNFFMTHASPRTPELWEYVLNIESAREQFKHFEQQVAFVGHSHLPAFFCKRSDDTLSQRYITESELDPDSRYIINVGSVGQPRDHDPRACYVTVDTDTNIIRYHRVEYDISKAVARIESQGLPQILGERLLVGR